ncbi:hypothetical protein K438DRAFT_2011308 [Mycena galopus ATCC 62051]|nr:hypothetical protein K438DRAFT_2011308 [Mycena galopus ATCC 62051]
MKIPPELIDKIISEFDLSEEYDRTIADTLKSCALVAITFVRHCQKRQFAKISVRDYERITGHRDEGLSFSPHIGSIMLSQRLSFLLSCSPRIADYVRTLDLCYNASTTEANFMPQILSAVTVALDTLILTDHFCGSFPDDPDTISVFSLPSLRRVELCRYQFANPSKLESLLSKAKCLKEFTLRAINFEQDFDSVDNDVGGPQKVDRATEVKLEKLSVVELTSLVINSMLNSFTTADIRQLKALAIHNSPFVSLLRANTPSIQKLKIKKAHAMSYASDVPNPRMMAGKNYLDHLDLEVNEIDAVVTLIPLLGDLENLTALKIIRITLNCSLNRDGISEDEEEWEQLDALLKRLCSGVQVEIHATFDLLDIDTDYVDAVKKQLPLLSSRHCMCITIHVVTLCIRLNKMGHPDSLLRFQRSTR